MTDLLADELQKRTRAWFADPDHRLLVESIRARLELLLPRRQETPSGPSPDKPWLAEAVVDPATDLQSWQVAGEVIRDVYPSGVAWTPDGEGETPGFFYDRYFAFPGGHALYFHRAGTPQQEDACILYQPQHPERYYQPHVSPDGRWLAVSVLNGSANNLLYLFAVGRAVSPTYEIISRFTGRYDPIHWSDDELICRAVEPDALNGQLLAFQLHPPYARRTLLPPGDLPLLDAAPVGNGWVASYLNAGAAELRWQADAGGPQETIPLPGLGTVEWVETVSEVRLFKKVELLLTFAYTDFARPLQTYTWQPGDSQPLPATDGPDRPFDPTDFLTRRVWLTSADGTQIPLFLAHRRDVTTPRPTILHAYGGLGYSQTPRFSPDSLAWLEMGGVYATVCARGGGEMGAAWHQAAVGIHKQRTFDDVLAAARWLVDAGITSPARLGLWGVSNGGLTAGACLTQQPGLFGAVVIESGLLDMLNYHRLGLGAGWLAEYGDPDDPVERAALAAYSPLHNLQSDRAYPPTLLVTHAHDPRVGESHTLAFAQALAAPQGGDAPVLLRILPGSGHGPADNDWAAERLAFLAEQLGLVERAVSLPAAEKQ